MATTNSSLPIASQEQFIDLCKFASICDFEDPAICGDLSQRRFVLLLLNLLFVWRKETSIGSPIIPSVQRLLASGALRNELASILFRYGPPSESQLETTFALLFQAAFVRYKLKSSNAASRSGEC